MSMQMNAAREAVQAKPCPKTAKLYVYPSAEQTQGMALIVVHGALEQALETLASTQDVPTDCEVDALNAVDMALQHVTQMVEAGPMSYPDFMHGWFMAASVVRLGASSLRASNSALADAMERAEQHFAPLAAAVDLATFAWETGVSDAD